MLFFVLSMKNLDGKNNPLKPEDQVEDSFAKSTMFQAFQELPKL
jgi:hypothetical protein